MAARATSRRGRRLLAALAAVAASVPLAVVGGVVTAAPSGAADTVTYVHDETIPVPPASTYSGSAGGDGWNVALSDTEVFNVFHHQGNVQVACHKQADATECYPPRTLTDPQSRTFGASGHSGAFYDAATRHVYVFTVRNDDTGGVVCFDAATAATETNPFCGFTPLTAVGNADDGGSTPYVGQPVKVGNRYFAFSWFNGLGQTADQNALLCFDISTHAACAGQPFLPSLGAVTSRRRQLPAAADRGRRRPDHRRLRRHHRRPADLLRHHHQRDLLRQLADRGAGRLRQRRRVAVPAAQRLGRDDRLLPAVPHRPVLRLHRRVDRDPGRHGRRGHADQRLERLGRGRRHAGLRARRQPRPGDLLQRGHRGVVLGLPEGPSRTSTCCTR